MTKHNMDASDSFSVGYPNGIEHYLHRKNSLNNVTPMHEEVANHEFIWNTTTNQLQEGPHCAFIMISDDDDQTSSLEEKMQRAIGGRIGERFYPSLRDSSGPGASLFANKSESDEEEDSDVGELSDSEDDYRVEKLKTSGDYGSIVFFNVDNKRNKMRQISPKGVIHMVVEGKPRVDSEATKTMNLHGAYTVDDNLVDDSDDQSGLIKGDDVEMRVVEVPFTTAGQERASKEVRAPLTRGRMYLVRDAQGRMFLKEFWVSTSYVGKNKSGAEGAQLLGYQNQLHAPSLGQKRRTETSGGSEINLESLKELSRQANLKLECVNVCLGSSVDREDIVQIASDEEAQKKIFYLAGGISKVILSLVVLKMCQLESLMSIDFDDTELVSRRLLGGTRLGRALYKIYDRKWGVSGPTLRQLLTNTSGLPSDLQMEEDLNNPNNAFEEAETHGSLDKDRSEQLAEAIEQIDVIQAPGTLVQESAVGWLILAAVVENMSAQSKKYFGTDLNTVEEICTSMCSRLGMTRTMFSANPPRRSGSTGENEDCLKSFTRDQLYYNVYSGMVTTRGDLLTLAYSLSSNTTLVGSESLLEPQFRKTLSTQEMECVGFSYTPIWSSESSGQPELIGASCDAIGMSPCGDMVQMTFLKGTRYFIITTAKRVSNPDRFKTFTSLLSKRVIQTKPWLYDRNKLQCYVDSVNSHCRMPPYYADYVNSYRQVAKGKVHNRVIELQKKTNQYDPKSSNSRRKKGKHSHEHRRMVLVGKMGDRRSYLFEQLNAHQQENNRTALDQQKEMLNYSSENRVGFAPKYGSAKISDYMMVKKNPITKRYVLEFYDVYQTKQQPNLTESNNARVQISYSKGVSSGASQDNIQYKLVYSLPIKKDILNGCYRTVGQGETMGDAIKMRYVKYTQPQTGKQVPSMHMMVNGCVYSEVKFISEVARYLKTVEEESNRMKAYSYMNYDNRSSGRVREIPGKYWCRQQITQDYFNTQPQQNYPGDTFRKDKKCTYEFCSRTQSWTPISSSESEDQEKTLQYKPHLVMIHKHNILPYHASPFVVFNQSHLSNSVQPHHHVFKSLHHHKNKSTDYVGSLIRKAYFKQSRNDYSQRNELTGLQTAE